MCNARFFLHHEDDRDTYAIQDAYLYGRDLLVAPVWQAGEIARSTYLPRGAELGFTFGPATPLPVPNGNRQRTLVQPAVFYRDGTPHQSLFDATLTL